MTAVPLASHSPSLFCLITSLFFLNAGSALLLFFAHFFLSSPMALVPAFRQLASLLLHVTSQIPCSIYRLLHLLLFALAWPLSFHCLLAMGGRREALATSRAGGRVGVGSRLPSRAWARRTADSPVYRYSSYLVPQIIIASLSHVGRCPPRT